MCIIAKFHRTDLVICRYSGVVKTLSYTRIDMVSLAIIVSVSDSDSNLLHTNFIYV